MKPEAQSAARAIVGVRARRNLRMLAAAVVTGLALLALGMIASSASAAVPGTVQWIDYVHGAGTVDDDAEAVVSDAAGNGYFAATRVIAGRGSDIVVMKRSRANKLGWSAIWGGAARKDDWAVSAAIDRARGRVYVGGTTQDSSTTWGLVVLAYTTSGRLLWARTFAAPSGQQFDWVEGLGLDRKGDVYVASGASTGTTFAARKGWVLKYSPAGKRVWSRGYAASGIGFSLRGMSVSSSGAVALGGADFAAGKYSGRILKYTAAGRLAWTNAVGAPSANYGGVTAVAFGPSGSVYGVGTAPSSATGQDALVLKYSASGTPLWQKTRDGGGARDDSLSLIAVGADGSVYAAGSGHPTAANTQAMMTTRFASDGTYGWTSWIMPAVNEGADSESLLLAGNKLYVGGKVQNANYSWTARVVQYALTGGSPAMSMAYDGQGTWGPCWVDSVALSGADGLFVAGSAAMPPATSPYTWDGYTMRIIR